MSPKHRFQTAWDKWMRVIDRCVIRPVEDAIRILCEDDEPEDRPPPNQPPGRDCRRSRRSDDK